MTLEAEVAAIAAALEAARHPSPEIKRAKSLARTLERKLEAHRRAPEEAVKAYNAARTQMVIDWALEHGLGFCSWRDHLVALDGLEGLVSMGARWRSGCSYDDSLSSFESRYTICSDCRHQLARPYRRSDGEYWSYQTFELKDATRSLVAVRSRPDYKIDKLAQAHEIELPPRASYNHDDIRIGETRYPRFV